MTADTHNPCFHLVYTSLDIDRFKNALLFLFWASRFGAQNGRLEGREIQAK